MEGMKLPIHIIFFLGFYCFSQGERPNVVFLVSEDNSVHYHKLYGAQFGSMPNVGKMAAEGLTFNHAFSNAPVCSVARSTLATGILAPRGGFQYHRKAEMAQMFKGFLPWSAILRNAGYYCANNSKLDYNFKYIGDDAWDQSSNKASWRNRPSEETPFFYMQSMGQSHESSLHFSAKLMADEKTQTPMDQVKLHPYHPDTPTFRYTHARYFDRIEIIDKLVGGVIQKLKQDGLLENTFVFYFGDHGGVLPRGKGYAYESGLHVPLVVRIPENFQHLVDHKQGSRTDGFVSFIDFGPTVLNLAGLSIPEYLDGHAFLGNKTTAKELVSRDEIFGYADRFDEKYDFVRTLRKGKWKYIRNYQGFYPDGLQNNYRYKMLAYKEWRNLYHAGKLNPKQSQFFESRPPEQLFDLSSDPHEVNNLAKEPKYRKILLNLRSKLKGKVKEVNDLSFYPESYMVEQALADPLAFGRSRTREISKLVDIADLALVSFDQAKPKLLKFIEQGSTWERYWASVVCSNFGTEAKSLSSVLVSLLSDPNLMVRMRAAEALALCDRKDPMKTLVEISNQSESSVEVLLVLNSIAFLKDHHGFEFNPDLLNLKVQKGEFQRRVEYFWKK
jgi:uncharacterized sulfatase